MKTIITAAAIGALTLATASPVLALDPNNAAAKPTQRIVEQSADKTGQTVPGTSDEQTGAIDGVALEPGENSFTEGQAKARIESEGFTNVGTLVLDQQGIWRAKASKGAMTVNIGLDYKGHIAADSKSTQ